MYLALLLLLAFSAFFSASETALSSVNRIRMKNKADDGDKKAQRVLGLSDDYDRTLSAILIGNNVVNLTASSISTVIATSLLGQQGAAVATAVITVLVLVFGEILPKSFAKDHAERVSMAMGGPLYIVKTLLAPLVWVFVQTKRLFTGRRSSELNVQPSVTEEELKTIIDTVGEEGVLDRQETDIIQSAIEFDNTTVQDILVPRVDMAAGAGGAPPSGCVWRAVIRASRCMKGPLTTWWAYCMRRTCWPGWPRESPSSPRRSNGTCFLFTAASASASCWRSSAGQSSTWPL